MHPIKLVDTVLLIYDIFALQNEIIVKMFFKHNILFL